MKTETTLCMGCMSEKNGKDPCPFCGYSDDMTHIASYLSPKTLLAGRYIVGKLFSYNGESVLYMGFDTIENRKVTIREYMPDTLCDRAEKSEMIVVKNDKMPLYKTYLAEFIDLHSTLIKSDTMGNLQTVLDVFSENNTAYTIMDFIVGITLKKYLASCGGTLSWEQIKELFPSALTTLGIVHRVGIIHRAISTNTIFITEKNELKIISFGISASRTAESEINFEVFSGYAPPEQYSSALRNGTWTDIYGISAVLYRCLTGVTPPSAEERLENDTLLEPLLINRSVPANVSKVLMKGLELDVEKRISTISEFVDKLFELPLPVEDSSSEFHVPTNYASRASQSRSASSDAATRSKSTKKKRKNDAAKKTIIIACAMGVVILIFLLAIFIPALTGAGVPEETTAVTSDADIASYTSDTSVSETSGVEETAQTNSLGEGYVIPDFKERIYDSIKDNAKYSYLVMVPTYEFNNDYASGTIFEQDVEAGKVVASGTTINLKISKGPEFVELPEFAGLTAEQYTAVLGGLGIKYEVKTEETSEFMEGYVSRCSAEVGDKVNVAEGETVVVYTAVKPKTTTTVTTTAPQEITASESTLNTAG